MQLVHIHFTYGRYSSVQQLHIYMAYCRANGIDAKIEIDATGKVVSKIIRPDGSISGHVHIANWLQNWIEIGAPIPKEVVSDDGKALIIASIDAFTNYRTINEYVIACFLKDKISCFKYAVFLKGTQHLIKKFFLVAIGQLIESRSNAEAAGTLRNILTICQSKSSGRKGNGDLTECSKIE